MTIEFFCDNCDRVLRTSDDKAGRTAKCPACGQHLIVPAAESDDFFGEPEPGAPADEFDDGLSDDAGGQMTSCPMCGEDVPSDSTRCSWCGESLTPGSATPETGINRGAAKDRVRAPSIGLTICGGLGIAGSLLGFLAGVLILMGLDFQQPVAPLQPQQALQQFANVRGSLQIIGSAVTFVASCVIIFGSTKMRKLESWGLSLTAAILAAVPCTSPCCLIGLPIGIWAIVILCDSEVKDAFA